MQRVWVASELYYPEDTSTGYFLTRIAEGLAGTFDVHVICGRPSYSARGLRVTATEQRAGTTIHRMPATRFDKDRLLLRLVNAATFTIVTFVFALLRLRRGDVVLVVTNPPTLPAVIVAAARLRGARTTLLVHDVYPEILAATGIVARDGAPYRVLAALFAKLARACDTIVVLGRDMRDVMAAKLGPAGPAVVIIPNWGDIDTIDPAARDANALRCKLGLDGKFVVQFSGNAGRTHDLDAVLDCAAASSDRDDVHFLLIGYGGKFAGVADRIARRGLTNITLLPRQPRDVLATMLTGSDLTVIPFIEGMIGLSVPSRMYNVMAAGVPIAAMTDARSELALVVAETRCGWILAPGDAGALAALTKDLAAGRAMGEARQRGDAGRRAAEADYTIDRVIARYAETLSGLAG